MNLDKTAQKLGVSSLVVVAVFLLATVKCDASAATEREQQQSQQPPPPPASPTSPPSSQSASDPAPAIGLLPVKRRKVWTNDDVVALRTPTDNYLAEKEAKQAAEAEEAAEDAARKADAKPDKEPPLDIKLPDTPEETEKLLKETQIDMQEDVDALDKLQKELLETPAEQQVAKQKEINRLTGNLETLQRDVKALQEHLQSLRKKSQGENPPQAAPPPSSF
jgi:hypothetical protein